MKHEYYTNLFRLVIDQIYLTLQWCILCGQVHVASCVLHIRSEADPFVCVLGGWSRADSCVEGGRCSSGGTWY